MIKDNQQHFNRLHVLIDAFVIAGSYMLSWAIQFQILKKTTGLTFGQYMIILLLIVPIYLLLYMAFSLYTTKSVRRKRVELDKIIEANTIGLVLLLAGLYLFRSAQDVTDNYSRMMFFYFYLINITLESLVRNFIRLFLQRLRRKGFNQKHMILVGYSRATEEYIDRIKANPEWGYEIMGILDDNVECGMRYRGVQVFGRTEEIEELLTQNTPDEIAITLGLSEYSKLEHIVAVCEKSGVHTKFIPDYNNIIPTRPYTEDLMGLPVINIRHVPLTNTFNAVIKRTMDLVGSFFAILIFSPVMAVTALAIKATSPGPLIYAQERVGLHNKNFRMYKFRSMDVQSPKKERGAWTVPDDPRVTSVGKIIRKTSIDELPQLFNILKGDMSLVGPRFDIKILFLTIFKGFVNKNAY